MAALKFTNATWAPKAGRYRDPKTGRFMKNLKNDPKVKGIKVKQARQQGKQHAGTYVHDEAYDAEKHDCGPWIHFPKSSRVNAIRFDYMNRAVQVTWRDGGKPYIYLDVPYEQFRSFVRAGSQGKYINAAMNNFDYRPATDEELDAPSNEERVQPSRARNAAPQEEQEELV